jgi:hypothetical protein
MTFLRDPALGAAFTKSVLRAYRGIRVAALRDARACCEHSPGCVESAGEWSCNVECSTRLIDELIKQAEQ